MTIFLVALAAILVLLALIRIGGKARTTYGSSARPTRDRRSGSDRRLQRGRVPQERRRSSRRFEDVASDYVTRIEGPAARPGARG